MDELVHVFMVTFNQKEYISEAIESVLAQKTNFDYKIIIGEDNSTDGTREIVKKYENENPGKILVLYNEKNLGPSKNSIQVFNKCTAKYVAILEGDDKWTDPHKLQKQVDFLELNPDFAMCSHAVKTVFEGVEEKDAFVTRLKIASFDDIVTHGHFIPTLSIVFRRKALPEIPVWFKDLWVGDIPLILLITHYGKNYYIDEIMGLKRKHKSGISQLPERKTKEFKDYSLMNKLFFYTKLNEFFNYKHRKVLNPIISKYNLYVMNINLKNRSYSASILNLFKSFYYSRKTFFQSYTQKRDLKKDIEAPIEKRVRNIDKTENIVKRYPNFIGELMPGKKILKGVKNVSYLTIGYFISTALSFLGLIYIARMLGPNDYGIYTTVGAFVGMFDIITIYGINKVVLREGAKDLSQMQEFLEKTTGIKNLFTFFAIIACIIGSFFMPYSMLIRLYIILFSFELVYISFNGFLMSVYKAAEKMQYNAIINIFTRVVFVSLSIAFLYMGYGVLALFIIALFSRFFSLVINYKLTRRFVIFKFWNKIIWDKTLLKPALIFSILSFSYFLATRIDIVMISILGTSVQVGLYGVAFQITNVGITLRNLFSTAFFPIFVKAYHKNPVRWKVLTKYALFLGLGTLGIAAIVSLFSEQIIPLLFGGKYFESGIILSVLIFHVAITFSTIPFANTLQATHNESQLLKICWITPVINIGLNYWFFIVFGLIGIAYSTLIVSIINILIYVYITKRTLKAQDRLQYD